MKPPVETVRISQRGKEILTRLKVKTGIDQWNILCRWALCTSLHSPNAPPSLQGQHDSNVEMSWKTFAGPLSDSLAALVAFRAKSDGIDTNDHESVAHSFRSHLERGISKLQAAKSLEDFVQWTREGVS
jgi:DNA sulfur modification protein DndE